MSEQEKNDLYYVCSLIEYMGRVTKNHRSTTVKILGKKEMERELKLAEVNHCLPFEQVADELIKYFHIDTGDFDSVGKCKYTVPGYLAIGKAYQRLVVSVKKETESLCDTLYNVFTSFISDEISNFNSSVYYSNLDYLRCSYLEGKLLP